MTRDYGHSDKGFENPYQLCYLAPTISTTTTLSHKLVKRSKNLNIEDMLNRKNSVIYGLYFLTLVCQYFKASWNAVISLHKFFLFKNNSLAC